MQKKLLTLAVAGALAAPALALAQSSVQVYGTVHLSANRTQYSSDTAGTLSGDSKYGVTSHASNWGLRSTETLGGGMTAWFQAEFNMKMNRDNGVADGESTARNSGVGLRGGFGNVYLGTWETPWAQTFRLWDVGSIGGWGPTTSIIGRRETTGTAPSRNCVGLQSAAGSGPAGGGTPNAPGAGGVATPNNICGNGADTANYAAPLGYPLWRRFGYAMFYESPIWSGVQAKLAIQPNERKSNYTAPAAATATAAATVNENPSAWSASLTWTGMGGRARAFLANMRAKDWTTVGQTDQGWTFGGGYDFGPANVGATYETYTYKTAAGDSRAKEIGIGIAIPLGSGKIGASYAKASSLTGGGSPGGLANGGKMWNIGYEWALSKRTALGVGVAKIDNDAAGAFSWTGSIPTQNGYTSGAVAAGQDQTNLFVSIRHSF
jgi:predicted porin